MPKKFVSRPARRSDYGLSIRPQFIRSSLGLSSISVRSFFRFCYAGTAQTSCPSKRIIELEADRREIARVERSALAPAAQPCQDLIDRLLYRIAGLSDAEAEQLERRLADML